VGVKLEAKEEILNIYRLLHALSLLLLRINRDKMTGSEREKLVEILNEIEKRIEILKKLGSEN
jgi:coenzyme F420-reducing hydrogenase delta subunit